MRASKQQSVGAAYGESELAGYWAAAADALLASLATSAAGLGSAEAARRLRRYGRNALRAAPAASALRLFVRQLAAR